MSSRIAVLFPGQGAYLPGILVDRAQHFPGAVKALETIDAVAVEHGYGQVSSLLLDRDAPALEELLTDNSDVLDLAIFATNAAAFEILTGLGIRADVLVGHSFGEFAALSAAGTVSVADVARMACLRSKAFQQAAPVGGGLVALDVPARRAHHLVGLLDDRALCVAVDNGPGQTIISGPLDALKKADEVATSLGLRATRLRARYAFHNPLLRDAADIFVRATADVELAEPRAAVFSPVLGRQVRTVADAREAIERNAIAPVRFFDGLLTLFREGTGTFIEAGARQALTGIVTSSLPPSAIAVPLLPSRGDMERVAAALSDAGLSVTWRPSAEPVRPDTGSTPRSAAPHAAPAVPAPVPAPVTPVTAPAPTAPAPVLAPAAPASAPAPAVPASAPPAPAPPAPAPPVPDRTAVLAELTELYAEDLGFPAEMLTPDIDLEADLGVDSAKQLALFQRVRRQYGLPEPSAERRVRATTLERIAELVAELRR